MTIEKDLAFHAATLTLFLTLTGCAATSPTWLNVKVDPLKLPLTFPPPEKAEAYLECMAPLTANAQERTKLFVGSVSDQQNESPANGGFSFSGIQAINDTQASNLAAGVALLAQKFVTDAATKDRFKLDPQTLDRLAVFESDFASGIDRNSAVFQNARKRTEKYLKAYFGADSGFPINPGPINDQQLSAFQAKLAAALKRKPDDPLVVSTVNDSLAILQSFKSTTSAAGFIAREGSLFSFPRISVTVQGNSIDHSQIGADVIRIILDAQRDAFAPLPVIPESTAASLAQKSPNELPIEIAKRGTENGEATLSGTWHFARSQSRKPFDFKISEAQFSVIEANSRSVEASVAGAVGKAIRGGSWGSLNNEAVARFIETAAGVLARHTVERSQWCGLYAKGNDPS